MAKPLPHPTIIPPETSRCAGCALWDNGQCVQFARHLDRSAYLTETLPVVTDCGSFQAIPASEETSA